MHVQVLGLVGGEAVQHFPQACAHLSQVGQALVQFEVAQVVGGDLVAQEGGVLFVLLDPGAFPVGAEDVLAVLDGFHDGLQLAVDAVAMAAPESAPDALAGHAPQAQLATALEDLPDGVVAREDEVLAVLDLVDVITALQFGGAPVPLGELGAQQEGPVVEARLNDFGREAVAGGLQRRRVVHRQEGVVEFAEADSGLAQLALDVAVPVEVVTGLEGDEGAQAQDHGSQDFVPEIEVVITIAGTMAVQDGIVGRASRLALNQALAGAEGPALFHALEDEVDAVAAGALEAAEVGGDVVFLADVLLGPLQGDALVAGEGLDPVDIVGGALAEHVLGDGLDAEHGLKPVDHLSGALEAHEVAAEDDAVKTVVYQNQPGSKELGEEFHRPPPGILRRQQDHGPGGRWNQAVTAGAPQREERVPRERNRRCRSLGAAVKERTSLKQTKPGFFNHGNFKYIWLGVGRWVVVDVRGAGGLADVVVPRQRGREVGGRAVGRVHSLEAADGGGE